MIFENIGTVKKFSIALSKKHPFEYWYQNALAAILARAEGQTMTDQQSLKI